MANLPTRLTTPDPVAVIERAELFLLKSVPERMAQQCVEPPIGRHHGSGHEPRTLVACLDSNAPSLGLYVLSHP